MNFQNRPQFPIAGIYLAFQDTEVFMKYFVLMTLFFGSQSFAGGEIDYLKDAQLKFSRDFPMKASRDSKTPGTLTTRILFDPRGIDDSRYHSLYVEPGEDELIPFSCVLTLKSSPELSRATIQSHEYSKEDWTLNLVDTVVGAPPTKPVYFFTGTPVFHRFELRKSNGEKIGMTCHDTCIANDTSKCSKNISAELADLLYVTGVKMPETPFEIAVKKIFNNVKNGLK
jgi:hypothetical protein